MGGSGERDVTTPNPHLTEAAYQRRITDYCNLRGLRWHHETDSRRTRPGYPDLTVCGPGGVVWLEVKTDTGRIRPEQRDWLNALTAAGHDALIVRPRHWDDVRSLLDELAERKS